MKILSMSLQTDFWNRMGLAKMSRVSEQSEGRPTQAFFLDLDHQIIAKFGGGIHQLEILPVILACIAFLDELEGKTVIFYIDNLAAQASLINAGSKNHYSKSLIYIYLEVEQLLGIRPWFSRVSSLSNVADGPSRRDMGLLERWNVEVYKFPKEALDSILAKIDEKLAAYL